MAEQRESVRSTTREDPLLRNSVIAILTLAGIFDGLSGNGIHSLLLFGAAGALTWDALRGREDRPASTAIDPIRLTPSRTLAVALSVGALVYAAIVGGFARYSWPMTIAVVLPGAAALIVAWPGSRRRGPEPAKLDPVGTVVWISVFVVLALWELTSLLLQPSLTTDSYAHPTISVMTDPILATHVGRSIALFAWAGLGWFLVER